MPFPAFVAPLIAGLSTVAGLASSSMQRSDANQQSDANVQLQREFAQKGIQWRVADAKAAGLHPLAALGAQTQSYQPQNVFKDYNSNLSNDLARLGQSMPRRKSENTAEIRIARHLANARVEQSYLMNEKLRTEIELMKQGQGDAQSTDSRSDYLLNQAVQDQMLSKLSRISAPSRIKAKPSRYRPGPSVFNWKRLTESGKFVGLILDPDYAEMENLIEKGKLNYAAVRELFRGQKPPSRMRKDGHTLIPRRIRLMGNRIVFEWENVPTSKINAEPWKYYPAKRAGKTDTLKAYGPFGRGKTLTQDVPNYLKPRYLPKRKHYRLR